MKVNKAAANLVAAKFDVITQNNSGEQFVIEGHYPHNRGTLFACVSLKDAGTAIFFAHEFTLTTRNPRNLSYDTGKSDLARKTTHAVRMENLECSMT
jgi:hypothetical protein